MEPDPYIGTTFYFNAKPQVEDAPRGGNGSQVLPVADLDPDFEGDPQDGLEYLFMVRREAATHAKVYRASSNPYATAEGGEPSEREAGQARTFSSRPSEEWRQAFVAKFRSTRTRMAAPPSTATLPAVDPETIPAPRQESAWRILVNGKRSKPVKAAVPAASKGNTPVRSLPGRTLPAAAQPTEDVEMSDLQAAKAAALASLELDAPEDSTPPPAPPTPVSAPSTAPVDGAQQPEYEKLPQLPTPALVLSIPKPSLIHVLSHFNEWFRDRLETYEQELNWVPSTIFAPPAVRRKPVGGAKGTTKPKPVQALPTTQDKPKKLAPPAPLPTPHEVHWILSILTRLDALLDGDDLSNLRILAKTLVEMVEVSESKEKADRGKNASGSDGLGRSMIARRESEEGEEARARCWMVVAAIAGVWKQEDLWNVNL
ncbi:hypothetical protein JCM10212_001816 [Sporobolomyces blumeae]